MSSIYLGVADFLGDLGMDITNAIYTGKENKMKREQLEWNKNFEREMFDWTKNEAKLQKNREDTAYQRKVSDMIAAGLNPVLAAGGSGASASGGSMQASSVQAPSMSKFEKMSNALALSRAVNEERQIQAQVALTKAQQSGQVKDNQIKDVALAKASVDLANAKKDGAYKDAEIISKDLQNRKDAYEQNKTERTGISKGGSHASDMAREATNAVQNALDYVGSKARNGWNTVKSWFKR